MVMVDNGDGTMTDANARLMWKKEDDSVQRDWREAIEYCRKLKLGGFTDWRLPSLSEFRSLGAAGGKTRSPYAEFNAEYWTLTEPPPYWQVPKEVAGAIAFTSEGLTFSKDEKFYVIAVRDSR